MAKSKIHWYYGCRWRRAFSPDIATRLFLSDSTKSPDWYCVTCVKAARVALAKEQPIAVSFSSTVRRCCTRCRSGAINPSDHGRTDGVDLDLCDVCYWRKRAQPEPRPISDAPTDGTFVLAHWSVHEYPRLRGLRWAIVRTGTGLVWCTESGEPLSKPTHFLPLPPSPEVK